MIDNDRLCVAPYRQVRPDKGLKEPGVRMIFCRTIIPFLCFNKSDVFVRKVLKAIVREMDMKSIQPETPCPTPLL